MVERPRLYRKRKRTGGNREPDTGGSRDVARRRAETNLTKSRRVSEKRNSALPAHEGEHGLNGGRFKGADAWKDEKDASNMQLRVGVKIGFTQTEIGNLSCWSLYANKARMQEHMVNGYVY